MRLQQQWTSCRLDYQRADVPRREGDQEKLLKESRSSYEQAVKLSSADVGERQAAEKGLRELLDAEAVLWKSKSQLLAGQALSGRRPVNEVLQDMTRALRPEVDREKRRFLQGTALKLEAFELAKSLQAALPGLGGVAVLAPQADALQRDVARELTKRVIARLVNQGFKVRSPDECEARCVRAFPRGVGKRQVFGQPAKLRTLLEVDAVVLVEVGQQATATAYDLKQRAPLTVGQVYHPGPRVWREANWREPDVIARVTFRGQRLSESGVLEENLLVTDGVSLRDGDQIQCELSLEQESYVYLLNYQVVGKSLKAWRLFPETELLLGKDVPPSPPNPLPQGAQWIPGRDHFFFLDETGGEERLYVVISRKPLPEVERLRDFVTTGDGDPRGILRKKLALLASQSLSFEAGGDRGQAVTLRGRNLVVREIRFFHVSR